jgi:hypothetical protein
MSISCLLYAKLLLFNLLVIGTRHHIRLVATMIVINIVYTLLVSLQGEIWYRGTKRPDLNGAIKTSGCKCVGILWIKSNVHDEMCVTLKYLSHLPAFLPIPKANSHVVGTGKDERLTRMNCQTSNIIGVSFEACDLFVCVVVENSDLRIVGTSNDPILSGNELGSTN